ncbi:MAG: hypothetical protein HYY16_16635, partial [Planctomycetes bacterium]|nr:hypothetical protein [Planctomycetota bacterium]
MRFRFRWTSDETDNDLYQFLNAQLGDPERDAVTASLSARFAEDLDGERDEAGFFAFDSLDDSYRRAATSRLYTAFVDLHRPLPNLRARAGRLIVEDLPEAVPMDGGQAWVRISDALSTAAFGGLPVNLFESSTSDDAMYGGWIEALPWTRTRARIEYLHL